MRDNIEKHRTEAFLQKHFWMTTCFQGAVEWRREEEIIKGEGGKAQVKSGRSFFCFYCFGFVCFTMNVLENMKI